MVPHGFNVAERPTERIDVELSRPQARWIAKELDCPPDDLIEPCGRAISFQATDSHGNRTEISVPLATATEPDS